MTPNTTLLQSLNEELCKHHSQTVTLGSAYTDACYTVRLSFVTTFQRSRQMPAFDRETFNDLVNGRKTVEGVFDALQSLSENFETSKGKQNERP